MSWLENPVLQRELLVNLRRPRAFLIQFGYLFVLSFLVYSAWPTTGAIRADDPTATQRLMGLLIFGQFLIAAMLVPSFASGAISGEKERKTYELLLTTPLAPGSILWGKLLGSLCQLMLLIFSSLPLVMICLPLGGVSILEALGASVMVMVLMAALGLICLACSTWFTRTAAALVVSYLILLPLVAVGVGMGRLIAETGEHTLTLMYFGFLTSSGVVWCVLGFYWLSRQLLYPPDIGSEGNQVVDEQPIKRRGTLVLRRDRFPDFLIAPPKREELMPDDVNPIYDKEMRSEVFSQGTLMLRAVIQLSTGLAVPLMAAWLLWLPWYAPYYICYVVVVNLLIAPVFTANSITNERERQTLELLLTTTLPAWTILWGKLLASLRVTLALISLVMYPMLLGVIISEYLREQVLVFLVYTLLIVLSCVTTATLGMLCSVAFRRTVVSMMAAYLLLLIVYVGPLAGLLFVETFFPTNNLLTSSFYALNALSPFSAVLSVPLDFDIATMDARQGDLTLLFGFIGTHVLLNVVLVRFVLAWLLRRWQLNAR